MRTINLFFVFFVTSCGAAGGVELSDANSSEVGLCAPREPGFTTPATVTRNGTSVRTSGLAAPERMQVQLVMAYYQGRFGVPPVPATECTLTVTNIGSSYRCTDTITGKSCVISVDIGGPSAGCDDPSHPTC